MHQHGNNGAFVGGSWVDIEDVPRRFLLHGQTPSGHNHRRAPRQRNRTSTTPSSPATTTTPSPSVPPPAPGGGGGGVYDVAIIGAGVVGCALARALARQTTARAILIDAADDVSQGASKANSGVIHAGYDSKPGTARAAFASRGCRMFPQLDEELHFGFNRCGSLVLARGGGGGGDDDLATLDRLLAQGAANGLSPDRLRIIRGNDEVRKLEPGVSSDVTAALFAADAGVVVPYELCIALAENAVDNGVALALQTEVVAIERSGGSSNSRRSVSSSSSSAAEAPFRLRVRRLPPTSKSRSGEAEKKSAAAAAEGSNSSIVAVDDDDIVRAHFVVNCAGRYADRIAHMAGELTRFAIKPRFGDYLLLHKRQGHHASRVLFPCPSERGKGILVQPTLWGNLLIGPTAMDGTRKPPKKKADGAGAHNVAPPPPLAANQFNALPQVTPAEKTETQKLLLQKSRLLVPDYDPRMTIHSYAGVRAKPSTGDWVVGADDEAVGESSATANGHLIHAAGIDSPGLTAAPALADHLVSLLQKKAAAAIPAEEAEATAVRKRLCTPNAAFNPLRAPIIMPKSRPGPNSTDALGRPLNYHFSDVAATATGGESRSPKRRTSATAAASSSHPADETQGPQPPMLESRVICLCERVTEAEIVESLYRSIPVDSTQGVRRRCRAGMGWCQGNRCEASVATIIARELGLDVSAVARREWPGSSVLPRRWLTAEDKEQLAQMSHL